MVLSGVLVVTSYRIKYDDETWLGGRPGIYIAVKARGLAKLFPSKDIALRYQEMYGGEIVPQ